MVIQTNTLTNKYSTFYDFSEILRNLYLSIFSVHRFATFSNLCLYVRVNILLSLKTKGQFNIIMDLPILNVESFAFKNNTQFM